MIFCMMEAELMKIIQTGNDDMLSFPLIEEINFLPTLGYLSLPVDQSVIFELFNVLSLISLIFST